MNRHGHQRSAVAFPLPPPPTLAAAGLCATAALSVGIITTYASAATPTDHQGFEGCTVNYTADSGPGPFTVPDLVSGEEPVPPPGVEGPTLVLEDEERVALTGVVDMHSISATCSVVIRIGVADFGWTSSATTLSRSF
jgi:hypothetical protein